MNPFNALKGNSQVIPKMAKRQSCVTSWSFFCTPLTNCQTVSMLSELCIICWCPSGKAEMSFSSLKWLHSHPSGWRLGKRSFHFTQFQRFCDCFSTLSIFSKCFSFLFGPLLIGSGVFPYKKKGLCVSCVKMCPLESALSDFPVFIVLTFNLILFSHHLFFIFCKPNGEKTFILLSSSNFCQNTEDKHFSYGWISMSCLDSSTRTYSD